MREAGTPPHFSRFPGRAGTPHPPLCQPSGTEEMLNELRSCAGQYELSRRLAWLPRGREVVLRLLLGISSECGALLNAIPVATTKLGRMGVAHPSAFVKMDLLRRQAVLLTAVLPLPWGATLAASLPCTGLGAADCSVHGIWPCDWVWPREMRVEGRGRPRKAKDSHGSHWDMSQPSQYFLEFRAAEFGDSFLERRVE